MLSTDHATPLHPLDSTGCRSGEGFLAVLAPHVQTQGSDQGVFVSASTMATRMQSPAAAAALQIMAALKGKAAMTQNCSELEDLFIQGKCAVAIADGTFFKVRLLATLWVSSC